MSDALPASRFHPPARSFPWLDCLVVLLLGAAVAGTGAAMRFYPSRGEDAGMVRQVRISAKPGIDLGKIEEMFVAPDYYVQVRTDPGTVRSETMKSTRIGNGLTFDLPVPLRLADIREVMVFDENLMRRDRLVDRVDQPQRLTEGGRFVFALLGEVPPPSREQAMGTVLLAAGSLAVLLAVVRFLRAQAL